MKVKTPSICPFCGCGCRLNFEVEGSNILKVSPDETDPVSVGKPCVKGLNCNEAIGVDRLTSPLIRENKNKDFQKVSWGEAYRFICENLKDLGPTEIFFTGSGEMTNEDNYLISKFARSVFKTHNVDCCARLCHAATVVAAKNVFGITAMPDYINDLNLADLVLVVGSNPATNYPVAFNRIRQAKKRGCKLIGVELEQNQTTKEADLTLLIEYSGITALAGGIINFFIKENLFDSKLKEKEGFKELASSIEQFTPEFVSSSCRIPKESLFKMFELIRNAPRKVVMFGMGITQHVDGTENAQTIMTLSNVLGASLVPMRGKVNVQGAGDMGVCPDFLPFGASSSLMFEHWGVTPSNIGGGLNLVRAFLSDAIKTYWIVGMNPAQSMVDLEKVHQILQSSFVIYQHHHPSKTFDFANVVLPTTLLYESDGTITNADRRVRKVNTVISPPVGVTPTWQILTQLAKVFGLGKFFPYENAEDIFKEIIEAIPEYANLESDRDDFAAKEREFARLFPIENIYPKFTPLKKYPYLLTTARSPYHFCTGELTTRSKSLKKLDPVPKVKISPENAHDLNIKNGDFVIIESSINELKIQVKVSEEMVKGKVVLVPFHFEDFLVNKLIPSLDNIDPLSGTPNYKANYVGIRKVSSVDDKSLGGETKD